MKKLRLSLIVLIVFTISLQWIWQKWTFGNDNDHTLKLLSLGNFEPCKDMPGLNSIQDSNQSISPTYICEKFNSGKKEDIYIIYRAGFYNLASIAIDKTKSSSSDYQILLSGTAVQPYINIENIISLFPVNKNIINAILKISPNNEILLKRIGFLDKEISL